jgi:Flp pilus assembly protein TadD
MAWAKEQAAEGRLGDARGLYRELVEEDPTNVRALNNLGILLDEMGDPEGAVAQLRAAKRIDPHNQEVLGNLSAALGAMGRYADAEEELRLALRLDPSNLEIRANLGLLLFRRGLYEQAAVELAVVCAGRPDDGLPLFYRGEALNRLGRVEEAIKALERVTELIPGNPRAYYTLGVLFDKKNAPDRAAAMYRKARELSDS